MDGHSSFAKNGQRRRLLSLFVLALGALSSAGCATIVSGSKQNIRFESVPQGAQVSVAGQMGTTPTDMKLPRKTNHDAEVSYPGYLPAKVQLVRTTNPWVLGNVLIGGLVGLLVDLVSGAFYKLEPERVYVQLTPAKAPSVGTNPHPPSEEKPAAGTP